MKLKYFSKCFDCGANVGEYHKDNCDIEICSLCGQQRLSCSCNRDNPKIQHDKQWSRFRGYFPGIIESVVFGHDLNQLFMNDNLRRMLFQHRLGEGFSNTILLLFLDKPYRLNPKQQKLLFETVGTGNLQIAILPDIKNDIKNFPKDLLLYKRVIRMGANKTFFDIRSQISEEFVFDVDEKKYFLW